MRWIVAGVGVVVAWVMVAVWLEVVNARRTLRRVSQGEPPGEH